MRKLSLALVATIFLLSGCGKFFDGPSQPKSAFVNTDITGFDQGGDFTLTDHNGKSRSLSEFKGKAVVIFFGYTQCPDVCPTTMAEMAGVMKELGPMADKVQVLFVTVDPDRDSTQLLSQYVPAFDPRFIGLTGDKEAIDKVAKQFKVFYQKVPGKQAGTYTMDHTAGSYVLDPQGRVRLFVGMGQGVQPIMHDLKLLLS